MEKEFVPYEESYQLKTLGFAEPCFAYYGEINGGEIELFLKRNFDTEAKYLLAPTFSQTFRWFRDNYELRNSITDFIDHNLGIEWDYEIAIIGTDLDEDGNYTPLVEYSTNDENRKFKTYEDAELACLRKLIQIVKNK